MKHCIRIPRILLPRKDERHWAVIACDQYTSDRAYWENVAREVGDRPSALHFILPEVYLGEEDEERISAIHEAMYAAQIDDVMYKLDRGAVLTARTVSGGVRYGLIAALDLEDYTYEEGARSLIRSSERVLPERLPARIALRRGAVLEFPHAMVFYKDKRSRIVRSLLNEDLERLYGFDLMAGGGRLEGWFVPDYLAEGAVQQMYTLGEPCFAVADGNHSVAAAKAYWEEIKPALSERERLTHPARFFLAELVNLYDPSIVFHPIHRLVTGVDPAAFCDFFSREIKCAREGNVLIPALRGGRDAVERTDALIARFLQANTGSVDYIHGDAQLRALAEREGSAGVLLRAMDKDDFFSQIKGGKNLPKKTFSVGEGSEKRYYLEGREISYD